MILHHFLRHCRSLGHGSTLEKSRWAPLSCFSTWTVGLGIPEIGIPRLWQKMKSKIVQAEVSCLFVCLNISLQVRKPWRETVWPFEHLLTRYRRACWSLKCLPHLMNVFVVLEPGVVHLFHIASTEGSSRGAESVRVHHSTLHPQTSERGQGAKPTHIC